MGVHVGLLHEHCAVRESSREYQSADPAPDTWKLRRRNLLKSFMLFERYLNKLALKK